MRPSLLGVATAGLLLCAAEPTRAQGANPSAADGPVLGARAVEPTAAFNIFNPGGTLRLIGWDPTRSRCAVTLTRQSSAFTGGRGA
jgi:hypothetical protein